MRLHRLSPTAVLAAAAVAALIAGTALVSCDRARRPTAAAEARPEAAPPASTPVGYRNEVLGFQLLIPLGMFPGGEPESVSTGSRAGLPGVQLHHSQAGCVLEVYVGGADDPRNPFDESDVDPKAKRYAAWTQVVIGATVYHLGMAVVSHAVAPDHCAALLEQIVPAFKATGTR